MVSRKPIQNVFISTLKVFLLSCLPLFSIEINQKRQLIAKLIFTPWVDFKSYLVAVYKLPFLFQYKAHKTFSRIYLPDEWLF